MLTTLSDMMWGPVSVGRIPRVWGQGLSRKLGWLQECLAGSPLGLWPLSGAVGSLLIPSLVGCLDCI